MLTIQAIHVSPVKSLGLSNPTSVRVSPTGIEEDRRFYLIDADGKLLTQRQIGKLVQAKADYDRHRDFLSIGLPDGTSVEGKCELEEDSVATRIFGSTAQGNVLQGDWSDALSAFCGQQVRLVKTVEPGMCYDEYPVSLLSEASVQHLSGQSGASVSFDSRRFRPNFLVDGCEPHEEDQWVGNMIRIGDELRLRVIARDPRCAITTHDPATGETDSDTLRLILSYRPSNQAAFFGVFGTVERPGTVSVGDEVVLTV